MSECTGTCSDFASQDYHVDGGAIGLAGARVTGPAADSSLSLSQMCPNFPAVTGVRVSTKCACAGVTSRSVGGVSVVSVGRSIFTRGENFRKKILILNIGFFFFILAKSQA